MSRPRYVDFCFDCTHPTIQGVLRPVLFSQLCLNVTFFSIRTYEIMDFLFITLVRT